MTISQVIEIFGILFGILFKSDMLWIMSDFSTDDRLKDQSSILLDSEGVDFMSKSDYYPVKLVLTDNLREMLSKRKRSQLGWLSNKYVRIIS